MNFLLATALGFTLLTPVALCNGQGASPSFHQSRSTSQVQQIAISTESEFLLVDLERRDIVSKDALIRVIGADGQTVLSPPRTETFSGVVVGRPDSFSAASMIQGEWVVITKLSREAPIVVATGPGETKTTDGIPIVPALSAIDSRTFPPMTSMCGLNTQVWQDPFVVHQADFSGGTTSSLTTASLATSPLLKLALDSDYEFYLRFGPNQLDVLEAKLGWIHLVSQFWEYEVGVRIEVSTAVIRTDPNVVDYPWNGPGNWDAQFGSYWSSLSAPEHQLVYAFLNGPIGGNIQGAAGIAGALCHRTPDYKMWGLTKTRRVSSGADLPLNDLLVVTAHELGHAMGATHQVPIFVNYGVMSFGVGDCTPDCFWVFPQTASQVATYIATQLGSCLIDSVSGPRSPVVSAVQPSVLSWKDVHFSSQGLLIELTGPGLEHTAEIRIGANTLEVDELVYAGTNYVAFQASANHFPALGAYTVHIASPGGTTQAMVTITNTNPPWLEISPVSVFSPLELNVYAYSEPNDFIWVLYNSLGGTFPLGSAYDLLSPRWLLGSGVADPNGLMNLTLLPFNPALLNQTIHVQCVISDADDGELRASDPVPLFLAP